MARKNFKVATTETGKTTLVQIEKTNVPTGKVVTLEDKKKRGEAREKQYKEFRIAALKRRAKRMKLGDEETKAAVEKLIEQLNSPNNYYILLMYSKNNSKLIEEAVHNAELKVLFKSNEHMYLEGDDGVLKKIREIVPEHTQIHPYVKKHPPILKKEEDVPKEKKKPRTKAEKKALAKAAKKARKEENIRKFMNRTKNAGKAFAKVKKQIRLLKYAKDEFKNKSKSERKATVTTVSKIVKEGKKNASKGLKKAA